MAPIVTESGIPGIGKVPWGTHFCHFYRTREDLLHSIIPYLVAGLENNEMCLWGAAAPLYADEARAVLSQALPELPRLQEQGRISIFDHHDWYMENQASDPVNVLLEAESKALRAGLQGLRCGGNIAWLTQHHWPAFYDYERRVSAAVRNRRIVAICSYNLDHSEGAHVFESMRNHHYTVNRRDENWEMLETVPR